MASEKTFINLDHTIIFSFLALLLAAGAFLGFRFATDTKCGPVNLYISNKTSTLGNLIYFENKSLKSKSQHWNFGDSTTSILKSPSHIYKLPGEYEVTLMVNNECVSTEYVTVHPPQSTFNAALVPKISARRNVVVAQNVKFSAESIVKGKKWEWRFGESGTVDSYEKTPTYVFKEPGSKTVTLIIDGDVEHAGRFKINVGRRVYTPTNDVTVVPYKPTSQVIAEDKAKKDARKAEQNRRDSLNLLAKVKKQEEDKKKIEEISAPPISDADLLKLIVNYKEGVVQKSVFSKYICKKDDIPVKIVNKGTTYEETLSGFLDLARSQKKMVIEHMNTVVDQNNCIIEITISGKKMGIK